ncbi:MAG: TRAP transporter fused permease subunit [Aquisalimonadaceae bacterium]
MADEDRQKNEQPAAQGGSLPAPQGLLYRLVDVWFHLGVAVVALFWASGIPVRMGLPLYTEQVLAALLMFAVSVAFVVLDIRGKPRSGPVPWYDWIAAVIAVGVFAYLAYDYPRLGENIFFNPEESFWVSVIVVPLVMETLRRTTGWALLGVFMVFFVYALFADQVSGTLQGRAQDFYNLMPLLAIDGTALFGAPLSIVVTVVLAFIFMGQLLFVAGGGDFFTDLSAALMGRTRGGSAKISIVASAFFGSISGSVVANVTSTGVITIPLMKRAGFSPKMAAGIESVASNGGQLMPPVMGAAAFIMADYLGVSYGDVLLAALVPALLYFLAIFIQVDLEAAKLNIRAVEDMELPKVRTVLRKGWIFPMPFAVLMYCLFSLNMPPETAAIYASLTLIVLGAIVPYEGRRITPVSVWNAMINTGRISVQIAIICGIAGMIIGVLNITGLGFSLSLLLLQAGQGSLFILLVLTAIVCIILGMSMPTTSLYILLATLATPALIDLGALPIAAHLFVLYFGMMSFITPPVCFAAFAAANIAGAPPMATGFTAMRLGWLAYIVPFLFVYSPTLVMHGHWLAITMAVVTAVAGIWLICCAIMGMMFTRLGVVMRLALGLTGMALLIPADAFDGALYVEIAGYVAGGLLVFLEYRRGRAGRRLAVNA